MASGQIRHAIPLRAGPSGDPLRARTVGGLRAASVDALTLDEALLLARELPHLGKLIRGELDGIDRETARQLALGVLNVAQGHPKLLELADGQAADPAQLTKLIESGKQAWRKAGGLPDGFFTSREPTATSEDYLQVIAAWTETVISTLSPGERDLFWYLCCLEEPDRYQFILEDNWADLRTRLGRTGPPSDVSQALAAVIERGLAADRHQAGPEAYTVHPGVADAGRAQAGQPFRDAADTETAAFWIAVFRSAYGQGSQADIDTGLLVRAGFAAVPYFLRQQRWDDAAALLESAFLAEPTRANAAAALPAIEEITARDPTQAGLLARVLQVTDPAAAEARLRAHLHDATARDDHHAASVSAGRLASLCLGSGRLAEALALTSRKADHTRQAGLGPWTQLADQVQRMQILAMTGQAEQVLTEARQLLSRLPAPPTATSPSETIEPWNVREALLGTACDAASQLGRWTEALDLNDDQVASMRDRHAPAITIARARYNDYFPLLRLGRADDALDLLRDCLIIFQHASDIRGLGDTLSALASTEDERGHGSAAITLERDALRYKYLAGDVGGIAVSYHNLGRYFHIHDRQPALALASHLASALIYTLTSLDGTDRSLHEAATDLRKYGSAATPPADTAALCQHLSDIPGTNLPRLITTLSPAPDTVERTLRQLIERAQAEAAASPGQGSGTRV